MDSYILPGLSFFPSSQERIATAEPVSADFLKYQLSRTPTPKRFSRNANRAPRTNLDPVTPRNEGNSSLTKTDFRPASELISHNVAAEAQDEEPKIAKRWPVPRHVTAAWTPHEDGPVDSTAKSSSGGDRNAHMSAELEKRRTPVPVDETDDFPLNDATREAAVGSKIGTGRPATGKLVSTPNVLEDIAALPQGHDQESRLSGSFAEKTALKRPKKRHPLPSAPPLRQQRAALVEIPNNRQFSIPDDERPAKTKKQKRPQIARNLPVDELELAEESLILPYDMFDSDEAESDPVEELPTGRVRRLRDSKEPNVKPNTRLAKEKQVPIRSSRKRPLTLSEFKIIKPLATPVDANEKTWQYPAIGDGFEGPERLPTGRNSRPTKLKRRLREQVSRPTTYYRALEIVEFKSYEVDFPAQPETPEYAGPIASGVKIAPRETEDAVVSDAALSDDLLIKAEPGPAIPAAAEIVIETIELDTMDVEQDAPQHLDSQAIKMSDASAQESQTEISMPDVPFQAIEVDQELAPVLEEEGEEMAVEENKDVQSDRDENYVDNTEAPQDMPEDNQTDSAPQVEDLLPKRPSQTHEPGLPPPATLIANDDKKRPVTKIKRQVTFSEEVKIQTVVEPESEEEYKSESEDQSQESDGESDKSQSTDSEPEKSQEEEDDWNDSDNDADDEGDDNEGANYPTTKLDDRVGSPELVSSGYYIASSSPAQPHFSFHAERTQSLASIAEDDENVEGDMVLDTDDEIDEVPEPPPYTPQSRKYVEEVADSEDEMLIPTSGATSPEKMLLPGSDGIIYTDYGEESASDDALAMQFRPSETEHKKSQKSFTPGSQHNIDGALQAFFDIALFSKEPQRNFADSGIAMTPPIGNGSSAASCQSHGGAVALSSRPASRKIKRTKTGLEPAATQ